MAIYYGHLLVQGTIRKFKYFHTPVLTLMLSKRQAFSECIRGIWGGGGGGAEKTTTGKGSNGMSFLITAW